MMLDFNTNWQTAMFFAIFLLALARPVNGTPISNPESLILNKRVNTNDLDILIPNGNDALVRSPSSITTQQQPVLGQTTYIGSGECKTSKFSTSTGSCTLFCTTQTVVVAAPPIKISANINCTTNTCSVSLSQSVTVSDSTTISGSFSVGAGNAIKGQAQLGASRTWSNSATNSQSYSFAPAKGDVGYIIFVPFMLEACGTFTEFPWDLFCHDWNYKYEAFVQPTHFDPMSCGQTPLKLQGGSADGIYSFCHTDTGAGCA